MLRKFLCKSPLSTGFVLNIGDINKCKYMYETSLESTKLKSPVIVLLPWWNASKKGIKRYTEFYSDFGYETCVKEADLKDFVWPRRGHKSCSKFLHKIDNEYSGRPIIIHAFSIGVYFYCLMTIQLNKEFHHLSKSVIGQVIDSPVVGEGGRAIDKAIYGMTQFIADKSLQSIARNLCFVYFGITKPYTVDYHTEALQEIMSRPLKVPCLFLSDQTDPMTQQNELNEYILNWNSLGIQTTTKVWESSTHAHHLKMHEKEYTEIMAKFLHSIENK